MGSIYLGRVWQFGDLRAAVSRAGAANSGFVGRRALCALEPKRQGTFISDRGGQADVSGCHAGPKFYAYARARTVHGGPRRRIRGRARRQAAASDREYRSKLNPVDGSGELAGCAQEIDSTIVNAACPGDP